MATMPPKMKIGFGLGMLGGIVALIAMAWSWNGALDNMYPVGLNMLTAVMFFAMAGTLSNQAPVAGSTVLAIAAVALASVVIGFIYGATLPVISIILALIGIGCVLIGACPNVSAWIDSERIA